MQQPEEQQTVEERQKRYWRKNIRLIVSLLAVWTLVAYVGGIFLAEPLSHVQFFGVSLSFWIAQQGSILVFILLIFVYAIWMDKLDREYVQDLERVQKEHAGKGRENNRS